MPVANTPEQIAATNEDGKPKKWNEIPMPADEASWRSWCAGCEHTLRLILTGTPEQVRDMLKMRARSRLHRSSYADGEISIIKLCRAVQHPATGEEGATEELLAAARALYLDMSAAFPHMTMSKRVQAAVMGYAYNTMLKHAESPVWTEHPSAPACAYAKSRVTA